MLTQEASVLRDGPSLVDDRSFLRQDDKPRGVDVLVMLTQEASVLRDNPSLVDDRSFLRQDDKQHRKDKRCRDRRFCHAEERSICAAGQSLLRR